MARLRRRAPSGFAAALPAGRPPLGLVLAVLLTSSGGVFATPNATTYVAHLMPWYDNDTGRVGNKWCDIRWGNSYYESVLGMYSSGDAATIRKQLLLMRTAGIDGVWIDLQTPNWLPAVREIVTQVTLLDMNFAVMVDTYADPDIVETLAEDLRDFMAMPNYYRVDGRALMPYFEYQRKWGPAKLPNWTTHDGNHPYILGYYAPHQFETELPSGYDSLFFWITPDLHWLEKYYTLQHLPMKVGSVYRGWRESYGAYRLNAPFLGYLNRTLELVEQYQPRFVQVATWNDYAEGTMMEPSYLRQFNPSGIQCGDPNTRLFQSATRNCSDLLGRPAFTDRGRLPPCLVGRDITQPCSASGSAPCGQVEDCSKPYGTMQGPSAAVCGREPMSAFDDLIQLARSILGPSGAVGAAEFEAVLQDPTLDAQSPAPGSPTPPPAATTTLVSADEASQKQGVGEAVVQDPSPDAQSPAPESTTPTPTPRAETTTLAPGVVASKKQGVSEVIIDGRSQLSAAAPAELGRLTCSFVAVAAVWALFAAGR